MKEKRREEKSRENICQAEPLASNQRTSARPVENEMCEIKNKKHRKLKRQKLARRKKTYRWLVCSWSLESWVGWEPERRSRQMAWRAATRRAKPWRATVKSARRASQPACNKSCVWRAHATIPHSLTRSPGRVRDGIVWTTGDQWRVKVSVTI